MNSRKSGKSSRLKVFIFSRLKNDNLDEFDPLGRQFCSFHLFSVKENKESALEAQNQLREEILGKLEDTNKNIEQVHGTFFFFP